MAKILKPPIAQKPITQAGYFNQVWSRFFLGIETESEKVQSNNIQQSMTLTGLQSSIAEVKEQLTDIFIKVLFIENTQFDYNSNIQDINKQLNAFNINEIAENSEVYDFPQYSVTSYKIEQDDEVNIEAYQYLLIQETNSYIIEGSLYITDNGFLKVL